jgi:hypothetical protein
VSGPERRVIGTSGQGWYLAISDKGRQSHYRYLWVLNLDCGHSVDFYSDPRTNRDYASAAPAVLACPQCAAQQAEQRKLEGIDR